MKNCEINTPCDNCGKETKHIRKLTIGLGNIYLCPKCGKREMEETK